MAQSSYYIDPVKFTELLVTYKYTGNKVVLDRLIRCFFFPLARGVLRKFNFGKIDAEDAIQTAVLQCIKQVERFTPDHPTKHRASTDKPERKAFSFFTTCTANTYRGMYRVEDTHQKGMKKLQTEEVRKEAGRMGSNIRLDGYEDDIFSPSQRTNSMNDEDALSYAISYQGGSY